MRRRLAAGCLALLGVLVAGSFAAAVPAATAGRDLQALIDATGPGDTLHLRPGTYRGPVTIDHPMRVVGEGRPVVDGGGEGDVFTVTAPDVRLEGLVIRNSGISLDREDSGVAGREAQRLQVVDNEIADVLFGVYLHGSPGSLIAGNEVGAKDLSISRRGDGIRVFESDDTVVEGNHVVGTRDTIVWFSDRAIVRDNVVEDGRYGLHFMYAHDGVIEQNRFVGNSVGAILMFSHRAVLRRNWIAESDGPSGYGIGFKDVDGAVTEGNRVVGNRVGVFVDGSPFSAGVQLVYRNNVVAFNDVGVELMPSIHDNVFSENAFLDNRQQVAVNGGGYLRGNTWSLQGIGNHWSDYAGYDADGDGIGDIEYRSENLFSDLTDRHPELRFFSDTPAARAVDLAARAFPVLRPDPRAVDEAPLVGMPDLPDVPGLPGPPPRSRLALVSLALLAGAAVPVLASGAFTRPSGVRR